MKFFSKKKVEQQNRWISLTPAANGKSLWVNTQAIAFLEDKGKQTTVTMVGDPRSTFLVKEDIKQILACC